MARGFYLSSCMSCFLWVQLATLLFLFPELSLSRRLAYAYASCLAVGQLAFN